MQAKLLSLKEYPLNHPNWARRSLSKISLLFRDLTPFLFTVSVGRALTLDLGFNNLSSETCLLEEICLDNIIIQG